MCDAQLPRGASHCHPIRMAGFWGGGTGVWCPAREAAGWEAPCSATTVMPKMAVKRGKREGNALNPLRGRNVAGKSLETNLSESLKCNTLASGKFCQFLERAGWSQLLGRAPSLHWQRFAVTWRMYFGHNCSSIFCVNTRDLTGGDRGRSVLFNKDCTSALARVMVHRPLQHASA